MFSPFTVSPACGISALTCRRVLNALTSEHDVSRNRDLRNWSDVTSRAYLRLCATTDSFRYFPSSLVRRVRYGHTGSCTRHPGREQGIVRRSNCIRANHLPECVSTFPSAIDRRQATLAMVRWHGRCLEYMPRVLPIAFAGGLRVCACCGSTFQHPVVNPRSH